MKYFLLSLLLAVSMVAYANDNAKLWDSVIKAKNYLRNNDYRNAEAIVNSIEGLCSECNNDSIRVVFLECKAQIVFFCTKEYSLCIPVFKEIIELYERLKIKSINYLEAYQAIAYCYEFLKKDEEAEKYYRKAIIKGVSIAHSPDFNKECYKNLYNIYKERGDSILANECLKYLDSQSASDVKETDYLVWENKQLEIIQELIKNGKFEDVVHEYDDYIDGIIERKGKSNEKYFFAIYSKAVLFKYLKRFDELRPLIEELISMRNDKSVCKEYVCWAYCNMTLYYTSKGLCDNADRTILDGIDYFQNANINEYQKCTLYRYAGNGSFYQRDYFDAIKYFELYFSNFDSRDGCDDYAIITNTLAVSYINTNQYAKAKGLLKRFLSTDNKNIKKDNEVLLSSMYHNLGRCEMLLNNNMAAKRSLIKSKTIQIKIYGKVSEKTQEYLDEILSKE